MGALSFSHWLVVLAVVLVVFGPGRLKGLMGDLGTGIRSFRQGLAEDEPAPQPIPVKLGKDETL